MTRLSRRHFAAAAAAFAALPSSVRANAPRVLTWPDLIPPGVPYSEIIGTGKIDALKDLWLPEFDEHGEKLNADLDGAFVKLPGFILPMDLSHAGVRSFILVPYAGACIHTPPPPPNQLVFVDTAEPWPSGRIWDAVWVTGRMKHEIQSTAVAQTGYMMNAQKIEIYEW